MENVTNVKIIVYIVKTVQLAQNAIPTLTYILMIVLKTALLDIPEWMINVQNVKLEIVLTVMVILKYVKFVNLDYYYIIINV